MAPEPLLEREREKGGGGEGGGGTLLVSQCEDAKDVVGEELRNNLGALRS